jgi:hypothetical protein
LSISGARREEAAENRQSREGQGFGSAFSIIETQKKGFLFSLFMADLTLFFTPRYHSAGLLAYRLRVLP